MEGKFINFRRLVKNIVLDMRYGGRFLGGNIPTRFSNLGAYDTENSEYEDLKYIFNSKILIKPQDTLVDVGCGKGRVLNWWLHMGLKNPIIGIEIDPKIAAFTKKRLSHFSNIKIINKNIIDHIPAEGTLFYLYDPFNADTLSHFANHIYKLSQQDKKPRQVIYYNCLQINVFNQEKWNILEVFKAPSQLNVACALLSVNLK